MKQLHFKKSKSLLSYPLMILLTLSLYSCEEKIDLDLDSSYNRLVVDGEISSEQKQHRVRLTISSNYFLNEAAKSVKGALVKISDNEGNVFTLNETPANSGIYLSAPDVKGIPGRTYHLEVSNIDINGDGKLETYSATSLMKAAMNMDSISFSQLKEPKKNINYSVNGWGREPETVGDYYMWKYYRNGKLETDTLDKTIFTDDILVNGNYIPGLKMFDIEAKAGDTIEIETNGITKEYYEFVNSFMQETSWSSGSFGGPSANIRTNISNGGLGYFNAVDKKRVRGVIR